MPNRLRASELNAVIKVNNAIKAKLCTLVAASIVPSEFKTIVQYTEFERVKFLSDLQDSVENFHTACNSVELAVGTMYQFHPSSLPTILRNIAQFILDNCIILNNQDNLKLRALDRVVFQKAPARKGGQIKDCIIVEEYLELAQQLHSSEFSCPLVFISSNTKDFCVDNSFVRLLVRYCRVPLYPPYKKA
ncbi:hypothetical protein PN36_07785 [Candidatus Thiomargarita nelsonii]|uniref:DUF4935 domain-containing protein n=1 Tax=Candidatus Thiomargarita nelsonii TaxID=1003181 RepID=A0A4E0QR33_9GAMM|nr:hypothetical protein PN36_07785 [Candidatus Thiomargarita nelsonii]